MSSILQSPKKLVVRIHFIDGSSRAFALEETFTARDAIAIVVEKLSLVSTDHFALHVVQKISERIMNEDEIISQEIRSQGSKRDEYTFLFKKSIIIRHVDAYLEDDVATHLIFLQLMDEYLKGKGRPLHEVEETLVEIASLSLQAKLGDTNVKSTTAGYMKQKSSICLPVWGLNQDLEAMEAAVSKSWSGLLGLSSSEAEKKCLQRLLLVPGLGTTQIPVSSGEGQPCLLCIGSEGISVHQKESFATVHAWPWHEIVSWAALTTSWSVVTGVQADQNKHTFETENGNAVSEAAEIMVTALSKGLPQKSSG